MLEEPSERRVQSHWPLIQVVQNLIQRNLLPLSYRFHSELLYQSPFECLKNQLNPQKAALHLGKVTGIPEGDYFVDR